MVLYVILFLLFFISMLALSNLHHLCLLEATDDTGAALLMGGARVRPSGVIAAILRGSIKLHFYQGVDTDISVPCQAHESANTSHPMDPFTQDWGEIANAAVFSTRELIRYIRHSRGSDEDTCLYLFIRSVILSTFLYLFFGLPITSTNIEEVVWIVDNTWRTEDCWQIPAGNPPELCRLIKPSPNPSGVLALLLATQRLVLAAMCILESRRENIQFLRRARILLRHPTSAEPDVTQLIERVMQSHPPVQSIHGRVSLRCLLLRFHLGFFIPIDSLPPSACILDPNGSCTSWLHKAAFPGQSTCGGNAWLVRTTAIILSAIETEIRQARLVIDEGEHGPEAWEDRVLRRLRVG
ncbi:hypothetical protein BDM02DRAFT_3185291 [Thelephora ganbajun]|uniref:Uncharacterized protein n=1 Tax=Thelephora ganbajun TaxID=370292 RepID=A0ACB6ZLI8_THEGA|nr:hypothetical protein BDM02DRAFT_3185291 [Thelephora ganbajun]